jgi:hypothetical protein
LCQITDLIGTVKRNAPFVIIIESGDDFQEGGFTRSVQTQDTDLGAVEKRKPDVFENLFTGRKGFGYPFHGKDDLVVGHVRYLVYGVFQRIKIGYPIDQNTAFLRKCRTFYGIPNPRLVNFCPSQKVKPKIEALSGVLSISVRFPRSAFGFTLR